MDAGRTLPLSYSGDACLILLILCAGRYCCRFVRPVFLAVSLSLAAPSISSLLAVFECAPPYARLGWCFCPNNSAFVPDRAVFQEIGLVLPPNLFDQIVNELSGVRCIPGNFLRESTATGVESGRLLPVTFGWAFEGCGHARYVPAVRHCEFTFGLACVRCGLPTMRRRRLKQSQMLTGSITTDSGACR